jgi:hypothetical protein
MTQPYAPPPAQIYKPPQEPKVKDSTARTLLWIILVILLVDTMMIGYIFDVTHGLVQALHHIGDSFNTPTDTP